MKDWKKEVFTIPNLLSLFRLLLIPVYVTLYLQASDPTEYFLAGTILAVSCITDLFDGKIARKYNMVSTLGKILDPLADKLTQLALTICLSIHYPVMRIVLVLFLIKETFQTLAGILFLRQGKMLPGALMAGKICTSVFFISLIFMILIPTLSIKVITLIATIDLLFLSYSFITYIFAYYGRNTKIQDLEA
jgi:cardiolipin synthase